MMNAMNETHFDKVYADNYKNLYKVAYRITGNAHDAEDALSEAFLNAYRAYDGFRQESAVSTWLYRITVNAALKYVKHRKYIPVERLAEGQGVSVDEFYHSLSDYRQVEDDVLYNDMRETCIQIFAECLPLKQRLTFILRVIMDCSIAETAEILGSSQSAVKVNLYRARETLQKAMEGKCSFLNPNSPCRCKLWVNYAIENNKTDLIKSVPVADRDENQLANRMIGEIHFLKKLAILYDTQFDIQTGEAFVLEVKKIMEKKKLKILQ
jgi:RNA polymerase sigma factor (sigma-70 family)